MATYTLYVIDDEDHITEGIKLALESSYQVVTFSGAETAIDRKQIRRDPDFG